MSGKQDQKGTGQPEKAKDKPKQAPAPQKPAGEKKADPAPAKPQVEKKPADKPVTAAPAQKDTAAPAKPAPEAKREGKTEPKTDKPTEGRKTADGKGPRPPREKKEGDEQGKDKKREGGDRPRRPKTEGGQDAPEGERREKKKRAPRERNDEWKTTLVVTIDTPVPPRPEKILTKPDPEKLKKDLDECDRKIKQYENEIEALKVKREKWRQDQKKKWEESRKENDAAYKERKEESENTTAKFAEQKKLRLQLEPYNVDIKKLDAEIKDLVDQQRELEKQFLTKSAQSIEDVNDRIEKIDYSLANDKLTGTEEKKLLAEKFALTKSIPVAKEYGIISSKVKGLRDQKRAINDVIRPILELKKPLDVEISAFLKKKEQDAPKNEAEKAKREKEKAERKDKGDKEKGEKGADIDEKKEKRVNDDPFSKDIEEKITHKKEQYKRKDKLRETYQSDWDKFLDQADELYKIDFISKKKDYLVKNHNFKQERAKRDRERLLEKYINEHTPEETAEEHYSELTNACDNLIPALAALLPQNRRLLQSIPLAEDAPQLSREEIEAKLKDDKKLAGMGLKLAVVKQSAEPQGNKKKDNKKKPETKAAPQTNAPETKEELNDPERKLILDIITRENFASLKLTPPSFVKELEGAIAAVEKKKIEIAGLIANKADEIKKLHEEAEKNVPSIDEIISQYKDTKYVREDGKGDHGHKNHERKGVRGGRGNAGTSQQWRGPGNVKHARREGEQERQDLDDNYEAPKQAERPAEKQRPQKPLVAEDFPSI